MEEPGWMATRLEQLYEEDFHAWTRDQAKALRRLAQARPNEAIDFSHLIDEVQDLGRSQRDAVRSHARAIVEHCLKLEHSAAREPRGGWVTPITHARVALQDKLTPSLRRDPATSLPRLYGQARLQAAVALRVHGEEGAAQALPETCPYTLEQILAEEWLPAGAGRSRGLAPP
jgi:hypothetical protein